MDDNILVSPWLPVKESAQHCEEHELLGEARENRMVRTVNNEHTEQAYFLIYSSLQNESAAIH